MKEIRYAYQSSNYHRKTKNLLFFFFLIAFLFCTFGITLIQIQEEYIQQLSEKWQTLAKVTPNLNETAFLKIQHLNGKLADNYYVYFYAFICFLALTFVVLLFTILNYRKDESYRCLYLGMRNSKRTLQFLLEAFFPFLYSCAFVLALLFLGHTYFIQQVETFNEKQVLSYYDNDSLQNIYSSSDKKFGPSIAVLPVTASNETKKSQEEVMDFSKKTLFTAQYQHYNSSSTPLLEMFGKITLVLGLIFSSLTILITYSVSWWSERHVTRYYKHYHQLKNKLL